MAEVVKTLFQFKRGLSNAWREANPILNPGEPGWTLDTHILKIGDGVTPWNQLDPISGAEIDEADIQEAVNKYLEEHPIGSNYYDVLPNSTNTADYKTLEDIPNPKKGDIAVVKNAIGTSSAVEMTAFVFDKEWKALSGNYNADNIYFDQDLITSFDIGNIKTTNGMATIPANGKSLSELWENIYVKEINTDLQKTAPSCSMNGNSTKYYLVGAASEPQTITLSLNKGSYDYGYGFVESKNEADPAAGTPAQVRVTNDGTGVEAASYYLSWNGSSITPTDGKFICGSVTKKTAPASLSCSGTIDYVNAGNPTSNLGKIYPAQAYADGTTAANSQALARWYYPIYQGFTYTDGTDGEAVVEDPANISNQRLLKFSSIIGADAYAKKKTTSATATKPWRQYFYAFPADYKWIMSGAKDSNNIDCTVRQAAQLTLIFNSVNVVYDIFYINNASDYGTKTITWAI